MQDQGNRLKQETRKPGKERSAASGSMRLTDVPRLTSTRIGRTSEIDEYHAEPRLSSVVLYFHGEKGTLSRAHFPTVSF
jgi:hypothetical protein